jgi:hypothetical protein
LDGLRAHPTAPKKPKASPKSDIGFSAAKSMNYDFYQKTKRQPAVTHTADTQHMTD